MMASLLRFHLYIITWKNIPLSTYNGRHMIYLDRIKEFKPFQRMFARNIMEQGRLREQYEGRVEGKFQRTLDI
jgi:hypothetical protein